MCSLYGGDLGPEARSAAPMGTISGKSGAFISAKWTAHPQHYRDSGYLTLGTGKVWHTEEGGLSMGSPGAGANGGMGTGMPPNQDPPSWSEGCSMAAVNAVANMFTCPIVRARPGRLSALAFLSVFLCKSVLYGVFVWARRALNS
jgi:hypothetical protein